VASEKLADRAPDVLAPNAVQWAALVAQLRAVAQAPNTPDAVLFVE